MEWCFLPPELQRFPVDECDHLYGHQREPDETRGERPIREGAAPQGKLCMEGGMALVLIVHCNIQGRTFFRLRELGEVKPVSAEEGEERGNMHQLLVLIHMSRGGAAPAVEKVSVRVSESIIDLGDDRLDAVLIIECVEERHRIEGVSEDARVGQRQDARGAWRPRLDTELTDRLGERATGSFLVIPVAQGDEIPAVVAKEAKPLVELRKLVEVDKP